MTRNERTLVMRLLTEYRQEHEVNDTAERPFPSTPKIFLSEDQCAAMDDTAGIQPQGETK